MSQPGLDYAFPHSAADEARRLELFETRLDPLTTRRIDPMPDGDPIQGVLVTFDTEHGNLAVTGSLSMPLHASRRVPGQADDPRAYLPAGNYPATWNGKQPHFLNIARDHPVTEASGSYDHH